MADQAENEHPLGFKRRQSKAFQGLLQKEPVTKSPFLRGSDATPPEDDPPPVPPKPRPAVMAQSSAPSPARPSLVTRRLHGPRDAGGRRQRRKTVTWDPRCDVLEFDVGENEHQDVYYSEDDYGTPSDEEMQDSFEYGPPLDDSIVGKIDSMIHETQPHTPPRPEDEQDAALLPPSPSPAKTRSAAPHHEYSEPPGGADDLPDDPSFIDHLKDEPPPFSRDESFQSIRSNDSDSLDPSNLSIGHSEVSLTNLDSQSLLADTDMPVDHSIISNSPFVPQADSSPAGLLRSRSPPTQEQSFERGHSRDRSFEARSTPCINASRYNSPRPGSATGSRSGSPFHQLFRPASTSSLGSVGRRVSPFITPEGVQQRLQRKSQEALFSSARSGSGSPAPSPSLGKSRAECEDGQSTSNVQVATEDTEADTSRATEPASELPTTTSTSFTRPPPQTHRRVANPALPPMMVRGQNPTHDGVLSIDPEPQPIDPPRPTLPTRAHSIDVDAPAHMDAKRAFEGLDLDFEHGFALGDEGMSVSAGLGMRAMVARHASPTPAARESGVHLGDVSALDRLMEDMAQGAQVDPGADLSLLSESELGERSFASLRVEAVTEGVRAATFALPDIVQDDEEMKIDVDVGNVRPPTPEGGWRAAGESRVNGKGKEREEAPPTKDAIRAREELIRAKKREARRLEEGSDLEDEPLLQRKPMPPIGVGSPSIPNLLHPTAAAGASGRPTRRRSMSTGDAEDILTRTPGASQRRAAALHQEGLLDITALRGADDPLADSINRELKRLEAPKRSKYHVREHSETIYASADADTVKHMQGAGDVDAGKAWKSVRRPSDMNEYAKQIKELRAQAGGKAHGKVFVRVTNLRNLQVPLPSQPTAVTCTLNNGIHFVTTPEAAFGQECRIDQEFELIEHSKLEFTLTIKVRRDPHIIAQFKANQPPPVARPPPQPLPPPASKGGAQHKGGGMRSFLGFGSPKKAKAILPPPAAPAPTPPPPPPQFRLQENLARYLKPDGSLARAFISFKDVAPHCDTRLLETAFPLIGQRLELGGGAPKAMQVGEIVLQIFRLPPLAGIPAGQLPQSLEECHRGLSHVRWHKATYQQGTLTQSGGDCATWRRRHFRIIGANMIAFNDVTKRAITTIDLRKAIAIEDDGSPVMSPASGVTARSHYDDDRMYGVERSFRIVFGPGPDQEITFFADTDMEKQRWLEVLRVMIGRIPPNPLWAELLWQQQQDQSKNVPPLPAGAQVPARNPPR
ncbi:uncharacterized protein TRAVEDRAFT_173778 [Trametes versicolor FP-101664 SS1]|uniref:uncharacterized protein n=2 Tax=Trametes versicolor (strain FP-101664) TaxID=717944 RepID=UPI000462390F|nr:uncharacterized protein TRAVEDRAFT_173778 [Trametes versicolor FP-101664 SS1]EIW54561.1 hypothetical protein TRAVEDRAFT_173778 [Trametes versicolor FP-101664 SS1]